MNNKMLATSFFMILALIGCTTETIQEPQWLAPDSQAQRLYSDKEVTIIKKRLETLVYPTTAEDACRVLGIDTSRLLHPQGVISGTAGALWTQLSETQYIAFQFDFPNADWNDVGPLYIKSVEIYHP